MAEFFTTEATAQVANTAARVAGGKVTGAQCLARVQFVADGTEATSDTVKLVKLPLGAVVIPSDCKIVHEAMGTAFSAKIGDGTDDDGLSTALDIKAAGTTSFTGGANALDPIAVDSDGWVIATLTAVTSATAAKKATFYIAYVVES